MNDLFNTTPAKAIRQPTLMLGECLERMQEIETGSVDMVMADLPYGTTACKWDAVIPFAPLWEQYRRVCKKNAAIVLTAQTPFDKVLGCSNLAWLRYEWIWEKTSATGFFNAKKAPMKAHENVLIFYDKPPVYNPIKTHGHNPINKYTRRVAVQNRTTVYGKTIRDVTGGGETDRYPRSVQKFSSDKQRTKLDGTIHPTQKPVSLMEYLIRTYTNEGETVLDNTAGSFTTGVAALKCNRSFIGIERDEAYFKIGVQRMVDEQRVLSSCGTTGTSIRDWKVDWPFQGIQNPCMELYDEQE